MIVDKTLFYSKYWPSPKTPPSVIVNVDVGDDAYHILVKLGDGREQGLGGDFKEDEKEENKQVIALQKTIDLLSEMLADALEGR